MPGLVTEMRRNMTATLGFIDLEMTVNSFVWQRAHTSAKATLRTTYSNVFVSWNGRMIDDWERSDREKINAIGFSYA